MASTRRNSHQSHLHLAQQIAALILERGMKCGEHLPEQALSDACGVSRTPIRSALKLLESKGILEWRQEKGYFTALDTADRITAALQELENAEETLANRILLDRSERRLDEIQSVSALARRYSTARSTVLFALKVLSQEGIVTQLPGRAWAFQPMIDSPKSASESFEMRLTLEPLAISAPGFAVDPQKVGLLRSQMKDFLAVEETRTSATLFQRIDIDFHSLIAESSGNRFVRSALLTHHRLRQASKKGPTIPAFRMHQAMEEHMEILDSLDRKQYALAADQMTVHLRRSSIRRPEATNRGISPLRRGSRP
ncbi:GntR family transcriptional regulator [Phaeobacter sp. HF9A]|nr:GntR family transcriptional regulator [Phaeobacter sp. HF9A]